MVYGGLITAERRWNITLVVWNWMRPAAKWAHYYVNSCSKTNLVFVELIGLPAIRVSQGLNFWTPRELMGVQRRWISACKVACSLESNFTAARVTYYLTLKSLKTSITYWSLDSELLVTSFAVCTLHPYHLNTFNLIDQINSLW